MSWQCWGVVIVGLIVTGILAVASTRGNDQKPSDDDWGGA